MRRIAASFIVFGAIGCRDNPATHHGKRDHRRAPQVVRAIERELTRQLGVKITARCASILGLPSSCVAILPDQREIPIRATLVAGGQWELSTRAPLITTAPIVGYVQSELADLGITDPVRCDPTIRLAPAPGDSIACTFGSGGGVAFVAIDDTGAIRDVQLALDRAAADARASPPSDTALDDQSRALAHLADDEDEDDAAPATDDAGSSAHTTAPPKRAKHRR